jgi:hypothetical protein
LPNGIPERVGKIALDAFVWTGEGSHTLEQRKKKLPEFLAKTAGPSTGLLYTASSSATIPTRWSNAWSRHLPTPS